MASDIVGGMLVKFICKHTAAWINSLDTLGLHQIVCIESVCIISKENVPWFVDYRNPYLYCSLIEGCEKAAKLIQI